jgi:Cd2+/Zn2+-exporting ATPase
MVVSLFALAQWLEAQSLDRARRAIGKLLDLAPADVLIRDERGERAVRIELVSPGALMIVKPGEKIGLDGIVRNGRSDVNQAPITGESLPIEKVEGDEVFAGTINGRGAIEVVVERLRGDSTVARIIHLVERAQAQRAPSQTFVERFARVYTPAVLALAVVVAVLPPLAGFGAWSTWIYRSLVLLVISCPCALVISTPVSIVSALSAAARKGVLIKGGAHLERLAGVRAVAFDKTGTLTRGVLRVVGVTPVDGASAADVLQLAAALETRSEHPIGRAIRARRARAGAAHRRDGVRGAAGARRRGHGRRLARPARIAPALRGAGRLLGRAARDARRAAAGRTDDGAGRRRRAAAGRHYRRRRTA